MPTPLLPTNTRDLSLGLLASAWPDRRFLLLMDMARSQIPTSLGIFLKIFVKLRLYISAKALCNESTILTTNDHSNIVEVICSLQGCYNGLLLVSVAVNDFRN